jgi:hypothetical protein
METNYLPILFGGVNVLFMTEEPSLKLAIPLEHQSFANNNPPEIIISVRTEKPHKINLKKTTFKTKNCTFYRENEYSAIRILTPGRPLWRQRLSLIISSDNSTGDLYFEDLKVQNTGQTTVSVPPFALDELMAVQLLGLERGLMFHSSSIRTTQNQGLLFAGVSGAGKSSTAKLWQESGKGTLLGDERVVVRKRSGRFWLISTAWHGKGQSVGPAETPLDYLFILHHAAANQAVRLKPSEAVAQLMARSFLPFWDRE